MDSKALINSIEQALDSMDKRFCLLAMNRYQERPIGYEFYHQFRKLIESGEFDLEGEVVQAEVLKTYQHYANLEKAPDFIFHIPDTQNNCAVLEFKRAKNLDKLDDDFQKLINFRQELKYGCLVEVIIGNSKELVNAKRKVKRLAVDSGTEIVIVYFDTDEWRAEHYKVHYGPLGA